MENFPLLQWSGMYTICNGIIYYTNEEHSYLVYNVLPMFFYEQVQMYAVRHFNGNVNPGYVLRGCSYEPLKAMLPITLLDNDDNLQTLSNALFYIYIIGIFFLIIGVVLVIWVLLEVYGNAMANDSQLSMDNYGLFWGGFVVSALGNMLLTMHTLGIAILYWISGDTYLNVVSIFVIIQWLLENILSVIVAIYYGCKLDLTIPYISYPGCKSKLNGRKEAVQVLSLWSYIMFFLHVFSRVPFICLALLALPSTVLFTLLIYLVAMICTVQFLAILFTFGAMKKKQRRKTNETVNKNDDKQTCDTSTDEYHEFDSLTTTNERESKCGFKTNCSKFVQILAFSCLFAALLCFSPMICAIGALGSYGIVGSSLFSVFSIVVTSAFPLTFWWCIRNIGRLWLRAHKSDPASRGEQDITATSPDSNMEVLDGTSF